MLKKIMNRIVRTEIVPCGDRTQFKDEPILQGFDRAEIVTFFCGRKPDLFLPGYLERWWLIPRNKYFNVYLHRFTGSDDARALHDHPWYSVSLLLKGEMLEHSFNRVRFIPRWLPIFRSAKFSHRLEIIKGPVWTLFITGPVWRQWGFHHPDNGWMNHDEYERLMGDE